MEIPVEVFLELMSEALEADSVRMCVTSPGSPRVKVLDHTHTACQAGAQCTPGAALHVQLWRQFGLFPEPVSLVMNGRLHGLHETGRDNRGGGHGGAGQPDTRKTVTMYRETAALHGCHFFVIDCSGIRWEACVCGEGGYVSIEGYLDGLEISLVLRYPGSRIRVVPNRYGTLVSCLRLLGTLAGSFGLPVKMDPVTTRDAIRMAPPFIGESDTAVHIRQLVKLGARSDIPVLIQGDSGTGKEIVARNLHRLGPRHKGELIILNCMEMPPSLLQSELFGHVRGSFTGALRDRAGLIESSNGGTFFLDEIGEMPSSMQASLLRVLQEREIRRLGSSSFRSIDVRFVFATNRDVVDMVKKGTFRKDLFFRINGISMNIPPLRARKEDILPLARHFLASHAGAAGEPAPSISSGALQVLLSYSWPGNVRELKFEMERILALNSCVRVITPAMISGYIKSGDLEEGCDGSAGGSTLPASIRSLEIRMIREALERFHGNRSKTAGALGITRQGLFKKLKRYGIEPN